MTIGFILAFLAVHFLELAKDNTIKNLFSFYSAPVLVLSVLIIPVIDMMRVFMIRIIRLRSPFSADRNHIHHRLLLVGLSPALTCFVLYIVNILFVLAAWIFRDKNPFIVFYTMIISAIILTQLPHLWFLFKKNKQVA